jgi:leader peptidase (prepilin peptidase)/N-methyltransferase
MSALVVAARAAAAVPLVPRPLLALVAGLFGLVMGSFLGVVICRLPAGQSLWPRSSCPSCGGLIRAFDNVPIVSWLVLRGRCRTCRTPIPARYPLTEAGTGLLFAAVAAWRGLDWSLPAYLWLAGAAVALAGIDLKCQRLPDAIVLPSYPVVIGLLAIQSGTGAGWGAFGRGALAGAALFLFYGLLWLVVPGGGMGLGDVKLAGLLGFALGWLGWGQFAVGALAPFLFGALAGGIAMAVGRRRESAPPIGAGAPLGAAGIEAGRLHHIAFGPWMCLGAAVGAGLGGPLWAAYLGVLGL